MRKIALFIEPNYGFTRRMMRGIRAFLDQQPKWVLHFGPPNQSGIAALKRWQPDGLLAHLSQVKIEALLPLHCPIVALGAPVPYFPRVTSVYWDRQAAGETAGRYFLARGFRSLAYFGGIRDALAQARLDGLWKACAVFGFPVSVYWTRQARSEQFWRWPNMSSRAVEGWLEKAAKPVGVMCSNDALGRDLVEVVSRLAYRIPQDVAILGSSNDDLICELSNPTLSSIEMPQERLGYRGAELLEAMLGARTLTPPAEAMAEFRVVTRASTDFLATDDPIASRAAAWIAERAGEPDLDVPKICQAVGVSRRKLERRFRAALHRTVLSEVKRVRLERASAALRNTHQTIKRIAYDCGYASVTRLNVDFRKAVGKAPGAYRLQFRPEGFH
jgi:LacI family transcriptional regulator